jgi:hypothetical protein
MDKFATQGWRGQILGPHGSGKSTLLAALRPLLASCDLPITIIDGFEERSWLGRWRERIASRARGRGMLVTAHRPVGLPTLIELRPDEALVRRLVSHLSANTPTPVTLADVTARIARHGENVREVLFELFDCHERLVRSG